MQKRIRLVLCFMAGIALFSTSLVSQNAQAWGHLGHQTVAEIASTLTTDGSKFWTANTANLGVLTNVPDVVWKSLPTSALEKPTHFFQPDSYISDPSQFNLFPRIWEAAVAAYTAASLNTNGTATWRAKQLYDLAVAAFKAGDFVSGLQYAGTMSHYIGDLSQPLHVAKNYDGQETGDVGIHAFFETTNVQSAGAGKIDPIVTSEAKALLAESTFVSQSAGDVLDTVFNEAFRAYSYKDQLLNTDIKEGRKGTGAQDLLTLAESRMADGAATLSLVLSHLWVDAGSPSESQAQTVSSTPAWVTPDYASVQGTLVSQRLVLATDDDCE